MYVDKQGDRHTGRQTHRETDTQRGSQTATRPASQRQTNKRANEQTDREARTTKHKQTTNKQSTLSHNLKKRIARLQYECIVIFNINNIEVFLEQRSNKQMAKTY